MGAQASCASISEELLAQCDAVPEDRSGAVGEIKLGREEPVHLQVNLPQGASGLALSTPAPGLPSKEAPSPAKAARPSVHSAYGSEEHVDEEESQRKEAENQQRMDKMKTAGRRRGVAAEGVNAVDVKDYKKPIYPKDDATKNKILQIIRSNEKMQVLFGHLVGAALDDIVNAFREFVATKGEDVIQQGAEGDCLYIVDEGQVDVFVARPGPHGELKAGDKGSKVVTLGSGALFGELALMYSAPRAATVSIASETCKLWRLDREPFKMLLAKNSQTQYELYEGWLSEVDVLKSLNRYELSRLSELLESHLYDADEDIIVQGEVGDKFYILEDGHCAAFIKGPSGEIMVKEYQNKGDYFGEIALLTDAPRKATVRARGEGAAVLSISKEDFMLVLGPVSEILKRDIDKYPQYATFLQ